MLRSIHEVDWSAYSHAYGPADDVGPQLEALVLGDEAIRRDAWSALWGNIHHQGTVYRATVPAVSVLSALASWSDFPDRREAICMLGAFAEGSGHEAEAVGDAVRASTTSLLAHWRDEPPLIQRALLLLSRSTGLESDDLRHAVLPERLERAWTFGTSHEIWAAFDGEEPFDEGRRAEFDASMDALAELESWAFSDD